MNDEAIFIEDETGDGEVVWEKADSVLKNVSQVCVRSPLLTNLENSIGHEYLGKQWILFKKPSLNSVNWLFRLRDVGLSLLALILLVPAFAVLAVLIKISSPGPVFYKTWVVGKEGRQFVWRKFRSMKVVPENKDTTERREKIRAFIEGRHSSSLEDAPTKVIDNKRVTSIGRFIRKYSIDELPQLWNVLVGQMTLVGPRPCFPYEAEFLEGWRKRRFEVKPGLTGVWQVFGRGRVGFEENAAMDVYYTYRRSFGFDLYLMAKTALVVLTGRGAA